MVVEMLAPACTDVDNKLTGLDLQICTAVK
jgi:hypothetical protein